MRRRVVVLAAAVTSMVAIAFLVPLAILVRDLAADRAVNRAERDAEAVARVLAVLIPTVEDEEAVALLEDRPFSEHELSVVRGDDTLLGPAPGPDEELGPARGGTAFQARLADGVAVYVPVLPVRQPDQPLLVVRVFVPTADLREGVVQSWLILVGLGLVLVLIAVVVADRLGRSVVKPVRVLSTSAIRLGEGDLDTRVEPEGPEEVQEMGRQFNRLAGRIVALLQREREAAADLSHRLRTPLTALRLDAEALPPGDARERVLDDLAELERMMTFVIREARRPITDGAGRVDLTEVITERIGFWRPLAEEQGRPVVTTVTHAPAMVRLTAHDAEAMVDALLGNIFAHTEEGSGIGLELELRDSTVVLAVEDDGKGFPDGMVPERGRSGTSSTGLGLDIVRRTAQEAGGVVAFGSAHHLRGARVEVSLPRMAT